MKIGDVLSMLACVITWRTICGFAALITPSLPATLASSPLPGLSYINSYARHALPRVISTCTCRCMYVCGRAGGGRQASPGEPYRRFLGERVEASPGSLRGDGRHGGRAKREREREGCRREGSLGGGGKLQARGCPIRRRASRLPTPVAGHPCFSPPPTERYATVIPRLHLLLSLPRETRVRVWFGVTCNTLYCYWLHYVFYA